MLAVIALAATAAAASQIAPQVAQATAQPQAEWTVAAIIRAAALTAHAFAAAAIVATAAITGATAIEKAMKQVIERAGAALVLVMRPGPETAARATFVAATGSSPRPTAVVSQQQEIEHPATRIRRQDNRQGE